MSKMQLFRSFMLLAVLVGMSVIQAQAQSVRPFPANAKRGVLKCSAAPRIVINNKLMATTPATRIYNDANLIVMPAYLGSDSKAVNYTLNMAGQVDRIWILTAAEAALSAPKPHNNDAGPPLPKPKVAV